MLVTRIFAIAAVAVTNVMAVANSEQTVSDIRDITHKTELVEHALENFNGGIPSGLRLVNAIYNAHTTSETARKNLGNSDPFSDADGDSTLDAYNDWYPILIRTLQAGQEKAPLIKRAGFSYIAQGMVSNLYNEKFRFEGAMHGQLQSNHSRMLAPSISQVDTEYRKTLDAFSN